MWANTLRSFYFFRAVGGHANDPDMFETRIKYADKHDLENILTRLGIDGLSESEPFGHKNIDNNRWFVSIDFQNQTIIFSKSTNYNVTDLDFEATRALDEKFENLGLRNKVDRDIIYDPCCVSLERYEELRG